MDPWNLIQVQPEHVNTTHNLNSARPAPVARPSLPGAPPGEGGSQVTLASILVTWRQTWTTKASTQRVMRTRIKALQDVLPFSTLLSELSPVRLRVVLAELGKRHTTQYANDIFQKVLRGLIGHALDLGFLVVDPSARIRLLRQPDIERTQPSWQEGHGIVQEMLRRRPESGRIAQAALAFGVGPGECELLKGEHCDLVRKRITWHRKKTSRTYQTPIFDYSLHIVESWHSRPGVRVFPHVPKVDWLMKAVCRDLGLPSYSLRSLRRCFTVHALEAGAEVRNVASWLGHKDAHLVLQVYGRYISPEHANREAEKLG